MAVVGVVLAVVLAHGGGDGTGTGTGDASIAELDVVVPATQPWTETSLHVKAGDVVSVRASGQIRDDFQRRPSRVFAPEGVDEPVAIRRGDPLVTKNHAALLGRVDEGPPFALGAQGEQRMENAGTLQLGLNDGEFDDNDGAYQVHVRVRRG